MDFDCRAGQMCSEIGQCVAAVDGGPIPDGGPVSMRDGGPNPRVDSGPGGFDAGPGGFDAGPTGFDAGGPTGTKSYLDRCVSDSECLSGRCVDDVGGTRMCTISCSGHLACASEHVCGSDGFCHHDDTGASCSTGSPASCELGLCVGNAATGSGHCTRQCTSGRDCPAGFSCADAGGTFVCVNIEHSCSSASQCETGICLSVQGCTSSCRTAADCPRRFSFLPQYTCAVAFGSSGPICVPPADIAGGDPIGAVCPAAGANTCRSGGCDSAAPTGPMCTQSCTQEGGCGAGLGCWPQVDGAGITFLCSRGGSSAIGSPCATGRQCDSGLCDTSGYCSRLCTDDSLCPSDMRCEPVAGFPVSLCRR